MGALELPLIVAGWLLTAGISGVGGAFAMQGRTGTKLERFREYSDQKTEKIIKENDQKIQFLVETNKREHEVVLEHLRKMENFLYDMRAELPEKYTLKSDHLRLADKVEDLSRELFKHREILLGDKTL
jgi:hypothetical protein